MAQSAAEQAGFCTLYGRLLAEFAAQVGEPPSAPYPAADQSIREEVVRCVWFGGHFPDDRLALDDGRRLEVLSPGWWNVEGGPDFVRAELLLEGQGRVVGNVEVHTLASHWYSHGHDRQPEYESVALHVVMWNDRDEPGVRSAAGRLIPQLTLSRVVGEDLEELVEVIGPEADQQQPGWTPVAGRYCGQAYREGEITAAWLGRLLDAAGDHRILSRASLLAELIENHSREQLLYERIAESLGYKNNRMPFMQLAGLLPAETLRELVPAEWPAARKARTLAAAFFMVSGLLDSGRPEADDPETAAYRAGLREAWNELRKPPSKVRLTPDHWSFAGTRPVNYPTRRIAALAALCAENIHPGLFNRFLLVANSARARPGGRADVALRNALYDVFTGLEDAYWSRRYTFGGARLAAPRALVGRERAASMVVDVLLPILLAHAERTGDADLAGRLCGLWRGMPRRPDNAVTRRMGQVLFGAPEEARRVAGTTRRQQGLHQLYRDCCRPARGCDQCVIYLAHRAGKALAEA